MARLFNEFDEVGRVNRYIYWPGYGMLENPSFEVGHRIFILIGRFVVLLSTWRHWNSEERCSIPKMKRMKIPTMSRQKR